MPPSGRSRLEPPGPHRQARTRNDRRRDGKGFFAHAGLSRCAPQGRHSHLRRNRFARRRLHARALGLRRTGHQHRQPAGHRRQPVPEGAGAHQEARSGRGDIDPATTLGVTASGNAIRIAKPLGGRLGGQAHRDIVASLREDISSRGPRPQGEFHVAGPGGGTRGSRFVDVAALDARGDPVGFYQVGAATSRGRVPREVAAVGGVASQ